MRKVSGVQYIAFTLIALSIFGDFSISASADEIPMTIDGQINCAHPANAITTTCRGEAPPPSVNTPTVTQEAPASPTTTSTAPATPTIPMTINGEINCAHPDNSITTTCWDRAQAAKISGTSEPNAVDCNLNQYKDYPVCTGIKPQSVLEYEKSRENSATLPATNLETKDFSSVDCTNDAEKSSPYCLPMTINGEINCAQAANAITTTCWELGLKDKANGRLFPTGVDCLKDIFKTYPVCTNIKPQSVIEFERSQSSPTRNTTTNTQCADPAYIGSAECSPTAIAEAQKMAEAEKAQTLKTFEGPATDAVKNRVTGSIDLKSRNNKSTILTLDIEGSNVKVKVVASKKGSPTITQQVISDADGNKTVKFAKNLKGYTVKIYVNGQVVDQTKVA